jgi:hypothetical protein
VNKPVRCAPSLKTLLTGLVDYAGLFPPADLDMRRAAENFGTYLRADDAWALGRFVCPATRLAELEGRLGSGSDGHRWRISVLVGSDFAKELALIEAFNGRQGGRAVADAIEVKAETEEAIRQAADQVPDSVAAYCEIPAVNDPQELLTAISKTQLQAKIRTGGITAAAFPSSAQVARFVSRCVETGVPFKATAGLHHPVRGDHALTYEPASPRATMHGFLNLFLAAGFARQGWKQDKLIALLEETESTAFEFDDDRATWRGHTLKTEEINETRSQVAKSFGSCSFEEPLIDLKSLELL